MVWTANIKGCVLMLDKSVRKSNQTKVSVIMPVHNVAEYLEKSVQSALNQTLYEIEVICIDDASQDNSWDILEKMAASDKRLTIMQNPYNLGAGTTRNIGLQLARGEYVTFWDADDWVEKECLADAFALAKSENADVCLYGGWLEDEASGEQREFHVLPPSLRRKMKNTFNVDTLNGYVFSCGVPFDKICRRQFLLDNGLTFQNMYNSNDIFFSIVCFISAERMVHTKKKYVHYHEHLAGGCTGTRDKHPLCVFEALRIVKKWLLRLNKWNLTKRFYNDVFIGDLIYTLSVISEKSQKELMNFVQTSGLALLQMEGLNRKDFLTAYAYNRYRLLLNVCSAREFLSADSNNDEIYLKEAEEIAEKFKEDNKKVAIWGYGKLGKLMAKACIAKGCELVAVYDSDISKQRRHGELLVSRYNRNSPYVDVVIVPNEKFIVEISESIHLQGRKELLFEASAWCNGISTWEECFIGSQDVIEEK